MKKIKLLLAGIAFLLALAPATGVLAGSPTSPDYGQYNPTGQPDQPPESWGVEKVIPIPSAPGGVVRIITDLLAGIESDATGWVTFWCQSTKGFQYNIGTVGLNPLSTYTVHASGIQAEVVAPNTPGSNYIPSEGIWIIVIDPALDLDLGSFKTDANGLGGVKGVYKLAAGYLYVVGVVVYDNNDAPVLGPAESPPPMSGPDTNGFIVY
jgi:hypothetical protein